MAAAIEKWLSKSLKRSATVPGAAPNPLVFDRQAFIERLMGDMDLVREITAGFVKDVPEQIHKLRKYIGKGDVKGAGDQAHSIKGAAANIGGLALSAAALAIEQAARDNSLEKVAAFLPELERQFQLLQESLQSE